VVAKAITDIEKQGFTPLGDFRNGAQLGGNILVALAGQEPGFNQDGLAVEIVQFVFV
jgi:hypothetical protein